MEQKDKLKLRGILSAYENEIRDKVFSERVQLTTEYVEEIVKLFSIPVVSVPKGTLPELIEYLRKKLEEGQSRWTQKYEDASYASQNEMEGYQWALNDIMEAVTKGNAL